MIKVNIEYLKLLDVLYIADWVINAYAVKERLDTKEYRELEKKFLSYAKEFGFKDLVEPLDDGFCPTKKFEDETPARGLIEEF